MKVNTKKQVFLILFNLFWSWFIETAAFVLLPLIVYLLVFIALGSGHVRLIQLPEWMFISIILFGESLRKTIIFYSKFEGFNLLAMREISFGILGIVTSSVFLAFSITAQYRDNFDLSPIYYQVQLCVFFGAVLYSVSNSIWIGWKTGQGSVAYLTPLKKEGRRKTSGDA